MYGKNQRKFKTRLLFIIWISLVSSLDYEELEKLGVACPPRDTCQNRTGVNAADNNTCECDSSCAEKGTCCIDSPYAVLNMSHTKQCIPSPHRNTGCHESYNVWIVTKCSPNWSGSSQVKDLCEGDASKIGNSLMLVPADNPVSGNTYRNYFCAVCNEDHNDVVLWNATLTREELPTSLGLCEDEVAKDLLYKEDIGEWGYWNYFVPEEALFISVAITIHDSVHLFGIMDRTSPRETCPKDVVWDCADTWPNDSVRMKCQAYMAVVQGPLEYEWGAYKRRPFRNIHCAICNHVTLLDQFLCAAYYDTEFISVCGPEHGPSVTVVFGHQMLTEQCREKGHSVVEGLNKCRPVISRRKYN